MVVSYNPIALGASVDRLAALFGETTGTCSACGRPVRLMALSGLVPPHNPAGQRGNSCPGQERPPAGEPLGHRPARPHHPHGWTADRPDLPQQQGGGKRPTLRDNLTNPEGSTPR